MPLFPHLELRSLLTQHLVRASTDRAIAERVADNLVDASLKGHDSHGVTLLPRYINAIHAGDLNPQGQLRTVRDDGPLLSFHGEHGFGQQLGHEAMEIGIKRAKLYGVAIVGLAHSHHLGRIGAWAEQVADAGLVSLHFANVSAPSLVLALNGDRASLGTNPFCVGIPVPGHDHVVLDFATSAIAGNKARIAFNEGRDIPAGCAVDDKGKPTTDPRWLVQQPRGALLAFGGHKGAGLSLICSLLGAALTGGKTESHEVPPQPGIINNMLSIIFDPKRLGAGDDYVTEVLAQLDWVRTSGEAVQTPGEPERRAWAQRVATGIYIDEVSWQQFKELDALYRHPVTPSQGR
nr:malate/lactate/ureidoglycolate dehydrogenase [uncultured Enterobacter sp.]